MSQPAYNPDMPNEKNFGEAPPPYPGAGAPAYPPGPPPPGAGGNPYPQPPQPYPQPTNYNTNYGSQPPQMQPMGGQQQVTTVVMTGNCPSCHMCNLSEETDACGLVCIILLVILFFPIGLLYLLCLPGTVTRHCHNCGYHSD